MLLCSDLKPTYLNQPPNQSTPDKAYRYSKSLFQLTVHDSNNPSASPPQAIPASVTAQPNPRHPFAHSVEPANPLHLPPKPNHAQLVRRLIAPANAAYQSSALLERDAVISVAENNRDSQHHMTANSQMPASI